MDVFDQFKKSFKEKFPGLFKKNKEEKIFYKPA
jgi:hypothetical protein